jgi:hypothetical protein
MDLELDPKQPREIVHAVRALLFVHERGADEWWQSGIDEALSGGDLGSDAAWTAPGRQGEATARPRRTPGAERA